MIKGYHSPGACPLADPTTLALLLVYYSSIERGNHFYCIVGARQLTGNRMRALSTSVLNNPVVAKSAFSSPVAQLHSPRPKPPIPAHIYSRQRGLSFAVVELGTCQFTAPAANTADWVADHHTLGFCDEHLPLCRVQCRFHAAANIGTCSVRLLFW